ncbi:OmpA family protein [Flavobacterium macrobrachii]|uniref:OmpA family protein n=1 Tax=Flavobacterium macrobrachii TaxID=591204 RepID=A0ABS2CV41_9FLAO|nr:OmpA family protein [Flavobacterium macrobrachii]MBM6498845.1 OmpA family protein [Flavobacterium macrobrachii]PZO31265.1 MAG: cell envelope biogenesis protein OmpA [Flavobacteriaceae bacterium]
MKKTYFTLSLMLVLTANYAQNSVTAKADKLFESYQYVAAIEEYTRLAESKNASEYIYKQLADSYYNVFDSANAAKWYAKATSKGKSDAETYYRYAQTLKILGKYQEANKQMDVFAKMMPSDARAKEHLANPNYVPSLANNSKLFEVAQTNINSKGQSDFGAIVTNDNTLYFTSTRNSSNKTDNWNKQPYLDIYQATRDEKGVFSEPVQVKELNTPFHDGPITLSADGKTMFFARDGHSEGQYEKNKKSNIKVGQQGIYKATKVDGKWTNVEALPFNSTSYSFTNPSLTNDGKTLYFASNMPGGFGESDLWKVSVETNGYGKPQNLGPNINTADRENFPFITEDNILYFATTGRQGLGGFDIYKMDLSNNTTAQNVGKPVNSEKDDFSFSFNTKLNVGYFSSNRNGNDVIFSAIPICKAEAVVIVSNVKTKALLANADVAILDVKGNVIATEKTNSEGKVKYPIECNLGYGLKVAAQNFESTSSAVKIDKAGIATVEVALKPLEVVITDKEVILNPVYFEYDKSNITAQGATELDKLVKVMKDNPSMVIFVKSHTDSKGGDDYNLKLSERRAQSTVQYLISKGISQGNISGKGFGSTEQKIKCGTNCTEQQDSQNRRSEFLIVKK